MISIRRLKAVFVARNLEFLRDRGALAWNFVFPFLTVFGMAFAFSAKNQNVFKVGVIGEISALPGDFSKTQYLQFVAFNDETIAQTRLRHHQIDLLVKPSKPLSYWINQSSPKGYLSEKILLGSLVGQSVPRRGEVTGREIRYVDWLVPGLLGMNMMFSALFGVGYVIVRYRKNGVLKRLKATPLLAFEFLTAQVLSRMAMILLVFAIVYQGSDLFLHYVRLGSLFTLYCVFMLGAACLVSLGLLIAARATSEELAGGLLNLMTWPMIFLSGVWFSLEGAPKSLQIVAEFFPLTHVNRAARAIMSEGAGFAHVSGDITILLVMTIVFLSLGAALFSWE